MCRRESISGTIQWKLDRLTAWTPFGICGSVRIKVAYRARLMFIHEHYTTNTRSSNVPQSSCVPASQRMEGICMLVDFVQQSGVCAARDMCRPRPCSRKSAPSDQVTCNCMADCSTLRCTCKKHNIECSLACGNCRDLAARIADAMWR